MESRQKAVDTLRMKEGLATTFLLSSHRLTNDINAARDIRHAAMEEAKKERASVDAGIFQLNQLLEEQKKKHTADAKEKTNALTAANTLKMERAKEELEEKLRA